MVIKLLLIIWLKLFFSCQEADINQSYINQKNFSIKNAIYIIRNREGNVNLELDSEITFENYNDALKQNFEIEIKEENNSDIYYFIKETDENILLSAKINNSYLTKHDSDIDINYALWNITPKINEDNKLIYYIQNKQTRCYWELNSKNKLSLRNISDESNLTKANEFLFVELYEKVKIKNSTLLDNEPIDVLIKYIDLNDEKLNRPGIPVINKDYENGEIKYCVRSILQNIPWIRKIFILMPNDEIKYFLPKKEISDKIVYVKDKDLLGFDSESNTVFQFNSHKMKKFGLSENFIMMDDDYFIAKPIDKNEMFYEENGQIYPALITSDYYEMDKNSITKEISQKKKKKDLDPHTPEGFVLTQKNAQLFLYDILGNDDIRFGKKLIEPAFTHNAIPVKLSDIEEIYNYTYNNIQYRKTLLKSKERSVDDLQFQTLYMCYVKNKYGRKTFKIPSEFYNLEQTSAIYNNNKKLFVINKSSKYYFSSYYLREKILLETLFPTKTKYECDLGKQNRLKRSNKILGPIINSLIEKLKEKNTIKNEISLDNEIIINNLRKYLNNNGDFKSKLKKELTKLKFQCFLHEIFNCIFFISFILFIIYRYMNTKDDSI